MEKEFYKDLKVLSLLMILSILSSCQEGTVDEPVEACIMPELQQFSAVEDGENKDPRECMLPTENPDSNFSINYFLREFSPEKEAKMLDAIERLKVIINSLEFKEKVLNHEYWTKKIISREGFNNLENDVVDTRSYAHAA